MYWFLYRDFFDGRWFFYNGKEETLKYTVDPDEARRWYDRTRAYQTKIEYTKYRGKKVQMTLPLYQLRDDEIYEEQDEDKEFLKFITSWVLAPKTEQSLIKFMEHYSLWKNWLFYEVEQKRELSNSNMFALQCMKDVILWIIRLSPLQISVGKDDDNKMKTKYMEWELWDDFEVEYEVYWEKKKTKVFWVYSTKVIQAMYPESNFNWHPLQRWQRHSKLYSWEVTYIVWARSSGKSMSESADWAVYLLKEVTSKDERIQEFSVQYHWLSQMWNQPYINYVRNWYRNLIDLDNFCKFDSKLQQISILDENRKRTIDFMTTQQQDPARGRRSRNIKIDEADFMDWRTVQTVVWANPNAIITMISTISPDSKAWEFYKRWKDAFLKMKDYEPIEVLIDDIWTKYWFDKARSREDYRDMIEEWVFEAARREFFDRRPVVALHYTIDDLETMNDAEKEAMIRKSLEAGWEDYMLAELYGEYTWNDTIFPLEWKITEKVPEIYDTVVLWYDEADDFDYPWLCAMGISWNNIYVDATWRLPSDFESRVKQLKELIAFYRWKSKWGRVAFTIDITRWPAMGRELLTYGIPQDMQIKWTSWSWYNPWITHKVSKDWMIKTAKTDFFIRNTFFISEECNWKDWLVEELKDYKKFGKKYYGQKKKKDDQVSAMLLAMYYIKYTFWKLFVSDELVRANVNPSWITEADRLWAEKYWKYKDERWETLKFLKHSIF